MCFEGAGKVGGCVMRDGERREYCVFGDNAGRSMENDIRSNLRDHSMWIDSV